jgi:hypothetical protein
MNQKGEGMKNLMIGFALISSLSLVGCAHGRHHQVHGCCAGGMQKSKSSCGCQMEGRAGNKEEKSGCASGGCPMHKPAQDKNPSST